MRTINYFQITKKCNNFWKVSFLVFFICKISFAVNAQENAEFKEFFSYVYNGMYFEYLGHDDASVYFFRAIKHNKEIQIKTNDIKTAALKSEITIKLSAQYSKSKILEYRFENGSIYILSMFFNQKHEKNYLFRESFDIKSGMSNSDLKMVGEMKEMKKNYTWSIHVSENKEFYALVVYNFKGYEHLNSYLFVFDSHFKLVYQHDQLMGNLLGFTSFKDIIVDNNGKVYFMIENYTNKKEAFQKQDIKIQVELLLSVPVSVSKQQYTYVLMTADKENAPEHHLIAPPEGEFVKYATIFNHGNTCFLTGVFSHSGNLNNSGLFNYKLSDNIPKYIAVENLYEFSEEFQRQYLDGQDMKLYDKAMESKNRGLWDYHETANRGMVPFHDGYLLFLEQTLYFSYSTSSGRSASTYYVGYNDYVYCMYVQPDGTLNNMFKIPKKQSSLGYPVMASSYKVLDGKLYFLFGNENYQKTKMDKMVLYIYDQDFKRETIELPLTGNMKFGLTTSNIWLSDNIVIGNGFGSMTKIHEVMIKLKPIQ